MQFKTIAQGAATQVWAATSPDVVGHSGMYLADCGLGVEGGNPGRNGFDTSITNESRASELWTLSEQLLAALTVAARDRRGGGVSRSANRRATSALTDTASSMNRWAAGDTV